MNDFVTSHLPLEGHIQTGHKQYREEFLKDSIQLLDQLVGEYVETLMTFTSLIVWLEKDKNRQDVNELTSVALPSLPHCTFITDKALHHIPPLSLFPFRSVYALQENLYHESLHQKLSATIFQKDILVDDYDAQTVERVPIPWRDSGWQPDRVLHATYVYSKVLKLRKEVIEKETVSKREIAIIEEAFNQGKNSLKYLVQTFPNIKGYFTELGEELLQEIIRYTDEVI